MILFCCFFCSFIFFDTSTFFIMYKFIFFNFLVGLFVCLFVLEIRLPASVDGCLFFLCVGKQKLDS